MRFSRLLLATVLSVGLGMPARVAACRCKDPGPRSAYDAADAVVLIKILVAESRDDGVLRAQGKVLQAWKAQVPRELRIVSGDDCVYAMEAGATYLLYLQQGAGGDFGTYACRGNRSEPQSAPILKWLAGHGEPKRVQAN